MTGQRVEADIHEATEVGVGKADVLFTVVPDLTKAREHLFRNLASDMRFFDSGVNLQFIPLPSHSEIDATGDKTIVPDGFLVTGFNNQYVGDSRINRLLNPKSTGSTFNLEGKDFFAGKPKPIAPMRLQTVLKNGLEMRGIKDAGAVRCTEKGVWVAQSVIDQLLLKKGQYFLKFDNHDLLEGYVTTLKAETFDGKPVSGEQLLKEVKALLAYAEVDFTKADLASTEDGITFKDRGSDEISSAISNAMGLSGLAKYLTHALRTPESWPQR